MLVTKNLGLVKAIHTGTSAPSNVAMIWYNTADGNHYVYDSDTTTWALLAGSVENFTDLDDVPSSYTGASLMILRVKADETGLEFVTEGGGGGGAINLADLADVAITGLATNDVITWNGSNYVNSPSYVRMNGTTAGFIPRLTGTNVIENGIMTDNGSNVGFGTTTYTYSFSFGGNTARSFGLNRHTTADTAGNNLSIYAGGATSGATNKVGGNLNLYAGLAVGNQTSQINFYTSPAGSTGTTDNTQTLKLNINGEGLVEFTTSTANSKWKAGHNLATILTQTTGAGIMLARPSDGSYTAHGGMFASATSDMLTFTGFGNGFRFVRTPAAESLAGVIIGSGYNASLISGVSSSVYRYQFQRTYLDTENQALFNINNSAGTNSDAAKKPTALECLSSTTNSVSYNVGIGIQVTGSTYLSSKGNLAIYIVGGNIYQQAAADGLYLGAAPTSSTKVNIAGASNHLVTINVSNSSVTSGNTTLLSMDSSNSAASANKYGLYVNITGGGTINNAIFIEKGNFVTRDEAGGGNARVGIGTVTPSTSGRLEIVSTTGGFITARMTATQASAITPVNGLSLYVTDTNGTFTSVGFWGYEDGAWVKW